MADTSLESDAIPNPPRPQDAQNETQTVEPLRNVPGREALERSIQRDTQVPTEDWQFKHMLMKLAEEMTDDDLERIMFLFTGEGGLGKGIVEKIKTPLQLFSTLERRGWLTRDNLLRLQAALRAVGRMDLVRDVAEYAQKIDNVLHFYPASEIENGYTSVKLHIYGHNYKDATRDDIQAIRMRFAELLFCPPEFIVIAGVEPATSIIITFHIPESYMVMLKDLLMLNTCKARLINIGIDIVEIYGEKELINCSDEDVVTNSVTEQQKTLYNVYQLLEEKTKLLDSAEIELIELKERIQALEKERFESEALLKSLKTEFVQSEGDEQTQNINLLKSFETLIQRPELAVYDKALILSLLDANTEMVSKTVAEKNKLVEQQLRLEILELRSRIAPIRFELLKMRTFADQDEFEKAILESFKKLLQSITVAQTISVQIDEDLIKILQTISRALRFNEREKLLKLYTWEPNEDIKQLMDNDSSFCLVAILHKEIRMSQSLPDPDQFISQCLEKVNRKDLEKKFKSLMSARDARKAQQTANKRKQDRPRSLDKEVNAAVKVNETQLQKIADQVEEIRNIIVPTHESLKRSSYFDTYSSRSPRDKLFMNKGSFDTAQSE